MRYFQQVQVQKSKETPAVYTLYLFPLPGAVLDAALWRDYYWCCFCRVPLVMACATARRPKGLTIHIEKHFKKYKYFNHCVAGFQS